MRNARKNCHTEIKESQIKTLTSFIQKIEDLYKSYAEDILVFRGHKSKNYDLIPSIGRKDKENGNKLYEQGDEINMFNEFCRLYYPYIEHRPKRQMDKLFLAQHYGLPTRLLDWTFNPLIALYFACEEDKEKKKGQVLVRNAVNKKKGKGDDHKIKIGIVDSNVNPFEDIKKNQIILPDNIDIRYRNQQGIFEIFADPWRENNETIARIDIPHDVKSAIRESLSHVGIDEKFVYPTLENLTKEIGNKKIGVKTITIK